MKLRMLQCIILTLALIQGYHSPALAQNTDHLATVEYEGVIAEPEVIAFVHEELRLLNFPRADQVIVIKAVIVKESCHTKIQPLLHDSSTLCFYARKTKDGKDMIQVPTDMYQTIMFGTDQDRNLMRAFIGHEATHLRLKHLDDAPAVSYLPACIRSLCDARHSRSHEEQADEGVRNDPAILYAISDYFFKKDALARAALARLSWFDAPHCADEYGTHFLWNLWSTHPLHLARAQRFKERADALIRAQQ